ncbi:hypothetical protein GQ53DRAFT_784609 [Thozetella sp. PMI_491]|nr:hypothetical protein GQ53DRAFT_784609 [Thozetella sp. PMI_491]
MPRVEAWTAKNLGDCTLANAGVRREWADYIEAVLCLQSKTLKVLTDKIQGAKNRLDDSVAYHMKNAITLSTRHHCFIWIYEKALRDECGYKRHRPYISYDLYAQDPILSPMSDGNATSMGRNGAPSSYASLQMVVNLGPKAAIVNIVPKHPRSNGLGAKRRCLHHTYTLDLILNNPNINDFYHRYLGQPQLKNDLHPGLHNAGYYIIGGDPGGEDFHCSPGDPAFYFRPYASRIVVQMHDPEKRAPLIPNPSGGDGMTHMKRDGVAARDHIVDVQLSRPNNPLGRNGGAFCYSHV